MNRLDRLRAIMSTRGLDCLAVVPGANLLYLTGLQFHLMERPTVAFFPASGSPAIVIPALEQAKLLSSEPAIHWQAFPWADEEGYAGAFEQACQTLGLAGKQIGAEGVRMRLIEVRAVERYAPGAQLRPADDTLAALRMTKDVEELQRMEKAVAMAERALTETLEAFQVGMAEREVAAELMLAMLRAGAEGLPFEPIVLSGPNSALPHGLPGDRPVMPGDLLLLDFGLTYRGYISDITRTFAVGSTPAPELERIYQVVLEANQAGRAAARPGASCQDVDRAARQVIIDAGFEEYFTHRTGHGLGLEGHEPPYIVEGNTLTLEPGMTFTVEPGIYLPGQGGIRIEDDVVITEDGSRSLTTYDRQLRVIG